MGKLVVINLIEGNFETGFSVSLQIWTEGDRQWIAAAKGKLPPAKELHKHYTHWQSRYRDHNVQSRNSKRLSVTGGTDASIINEIKQASKQLKLSLNNWLKPDSNFSPIRETLFQSLKDESEEIRVIFETGNPDLQRLPWHFWDDFFQHYYRAEVVLSLPVKKRQIANIRDKVKVIAVFGKTETFGSATRIKTEQDWEMLKNLLAEGSNATLIRLEKPSLDYLCQQIDEHRPQILFFAGHSRSEEDGESGFIDLNDEEESITIDDLEPDLRKAVKRGLQLAIFNSCDGLGIARQLAKLDVPNIIVMREPVPDEVAQKFLQRFLEAFAAGKPLHLAVRRAREKINRLENKFPGATWLPTTFQNPAELPLTWRSLGGVEIKKQSNQITAASIESQTDNSDSILWLSTTVNPSLLSQAQPKTVVSNLSEFPTQIESESTVLETICTCCGAKNPVELTFCGQCGFTFSEPLQQLSQTLKNLLITCPNCNYANPLGATQCEACYIALTEQLAPTSFTINHLKTAWTNVSPVVSSHQNQATTALGTGSVVGGRYKILNILGRGGFSITFLAQDIQRPGNPMCVVKELNPMLSDPSALKIARRLFYREAEVLQNLGNDHDQIPRLLAHFEENQEFYLIQEFIDGHDLGKELLPGKVFTENEVISLLQDVLKILEFIHQKHIIHRDIKPSNLIKRKDDNKLFLIDFGSVKELTSITTIFPDSNNLSTTVSIGTIGYASPEQMQNLRIDK
ncbi:MAG: CHAT domain-containing protein [Rhizonema sp. PD38]|nr:CHAT domain-containing protein [Rhizonema sp. PD38]